MDGRRALRRGRQPLLRRVPRQGRRASGPATGSRCGSPAPSAQGPGRERALHLPGARRQGRARCWCSPTRTTRASTRPTRPGRTPRATPSSTSTRSGQRHPLGGLGRRQGRRAARPRRARPLRRGRLVPGRQPAHPGRRRRRRSPTFDRPVPGLAGRRPREGPRCSTCGRTSTRAASSCTPVRPQLLRPAARRQRRRHLLRPEGASGAAVRHHRRASATTASCCRTTSCSTTWAPSTAPMLGRPTGFTGDGRPVRRGRTPRWRARRPTR